MNRLVPLYRFGWAFLLAWVFCVFYTQVVEGYTGAMPAMTESSDDVIKLLFIGLPVLSSVVTLLLIVRLEGRFGSPVEHPVLFWLAPLATALSCPLLFMQYGSFELTLLLFIIGALLTGVGSGCMWVMWGEYYAKISQDDVEHIAPISTAVAAVLVLLVSSMSGWVSLLIVMSFPLLSGLCFVLSWRSVGQQAATAEYSGEAEERTFNSTRLQAASTPWSAIRTMGRAGFGIMVACLFVCILGSFWKMPEGELFSHQIVIAVSILFTIVVSIVSAKGPQRISVTFLLRWLCPVLVLGFVIIIIWGPSNGGYVAYIIAIAARFAFCLITQMFFARFASLGRTTAAQAYGLGWTFVHLGDFIGVISFVALDSLRAGGLVSINETAAVSIALLTILTMFLLGSPKGSLFDSTVGGTGTVESPEPDAAKQLEGAGEPSTTHARGLEQRTRTLSKTYGLTPRETEVFGLLARGRSVPFIRDALVISRDTAATHVKHVYTKLGVHSRQELLDLVHDGRVE